MMQPRNVQINRMMKSMKLRFGGEIKIYNLEASKQYLTMKQKIHLRSQDALESTIRPKDCLISETPVI